MGRRNSSTTVKSQTLPSSPTHSFTSSSSDFEFTTSLSPHKSSAAFIPADELFYKGQLLPLHTSPRLSMVRTLLLSSPSTSSDTTSTTASRDSTASHSSSDSSTDLLCDSSRPSSATEEDQFIKRIPADDFPSRKSSKYFSLAKFSSVFRKENKSAAPSGSAAAVKRVSSTAREVLRKYLMKVKPLYDKLSQKQQQQPKTPPSKIPRSGKAKDEEFLTGINYSNENTSSRKISQSFSGNLRYPRRRSYISSCPSSMMSSPRRGESGLGVTHMDRAGSGSYKVDTSSMEELQSAIQGAIAHCKNSMMKNSNILVSNEI